jgi:hypothetical protein
MTGAVATGAYGARVMFFLPGARRAEQYSVEAGVLAFARGGRDYSCGTALDSHQLPPLHPGIRAFGIPRRYGVVRVQWAYYSIGDGVGGFAANTIT